LGLSEWIHCTQSLKRLEGLPSERNNLLTFSFFHLPHSFGTPHLPMEFMEHLKASFIPRKGLGKSIRIFRPPRKTSFPAVVEIFFASPICKIDQNDCSAPSF
jgi:hypothetical protein